METEVVTRRPEHWDRGGVDFDLHGTVGIRVLGARGEDAAKVERQLGPVRSRLDREPDVTIRFVDRLDPDGPVTYSSWPDTGATADNFYLLQGRAGAPGRAIVPFQDVGGRCELVCERRLPVVPLLLAIVNFTALAKGLLPLHASAYVLDGRGVLATGWAKGGKTETLLGSVAHGAHYVGDEWVYLSEDGEMFGVPEPIRLWRWQLRQSPVLWRRVPLRDRTRMSVLNAVSAGATALLRQGADHGALASVVRRARPVLDRQIYVQVPPARLVGGERMALRGHVGDILFVTSHDEPTIRVDDVEGDEVAERMLASLAEEREPFMAFYRRFCFAFPDRRSDVVERAVSMERDLLHKVLGGRSLAWVRHPYPVDIAALHETVSDALGRRSAAGRS